MTGTEGLHRLVSLAHRHRWRLVAVGDPARLPAVGRGGVFAHWCNTIPHHELTSPRRFDQQWEADASLALRTGDPRAVEAYQQHERLSSVHPALIARQVAEAHQRQTAKRHSVAITTNTAETARVINTEIQRRLDPLGHRPLIRLSDGTQVAVGDQIATRRNDPTLRTDQGEKIRNRHTWTVTAHDPSGGLVVSHPERGTVTLPGNYVERHVELGWAVTGYGNQGDTVDVCIAVLEAGTSRNHAYVALTRGRRSNHALITDPTGTLDPGAALTGMITRETNHTSALATHHRLHQDAGMFAPALVAARSELEPGRQDDDLTNQSGGRPLPSEPGIDERIRAMQARLDRLETQGNRSVDRSLGR